MEDYNSIYPQAPPMPQEGDHFRLQKASEALYYIENEMRQYKNVRKKYNRVRGMFTKISVSSGVLSTILSASGLGTSLTGFGAVVGIPLGAVGGVCGEVSVVFGMGSMLSHKVSKHEQTVALAKAKANTIRDLVSNALQDNAISNQEFSLILAEADKFEKLKYEIRQKTRKEVQKKVDMTKIRTDV